MVPTLTTVQVQSVISGRLLECEVWNRINARWLQDSHGDAVRGLIGRIAIVDDAACTRASLICFPFQFAAFDAEASRAP
jgi:hypothetical protein